MDPIQPRKADDAVDIKKSPMTHEEETYSADLNAFGNGHTTIEEEKAGWKDPK